MSGLSGADFLAESNACGMALLRLVSRGNAIIAELLRLAEVTPPVFKYGADAQSSRGGGQRLAEGQQEAEKYADLIFDFSYLGQSELYENKIALSVELQDLDEEFKESHVKILTRFYNAFESVHKFVVDLNRFLADLDEGVHIQQTMESVIHNLHGKQLLAEALYLYGIMLLVVDMRIPGIVRERMLVSYHRYMGGASGSSMQSGRTDYSNFDDIVKLLRTTSYSNNPANPRRPVNYPESFFNRVTINHEFLSMIVGRLRSDDLYHQIESFPLPGHRSTALANQAAMLFVALFFAPDILNNEPSTMREIVDKFFPDNWVVSVYMGITVNLVDAWEPYKSARAALANTVEMGNNNVRLLATKFRTKLTTLKPTVTKLLTQGVLTEEFVLDSIPKIMATLRECNVTIRWLMLHTANPSQETTKGNKKCRQIKEILDVVAASGEGNMQNDLFCLLLDVSQLEYKLKEMFKSMLAHKEEKWNAAKAEGKDRCVELAEVFSGTKPLARVEKNDQLRAWLMKTSEEIEGLGYTNSTSAGRQIIQLMQALEDVQEYHQIDSNLQVKQFLKETRDILHKMLRTINIKDETLILMQVIGDLSYAWEIIDHHFTPIMQSRVKADPTSVTKLRATFLKQASALALPLFRINQANSDDLASVSHYYSGELVSYVRKVLQIIPETMFINLAAIINLQTNDIKEVPTRLDKDKLRDYAQLEERNEVARLTRSVSVFTEGILMMKTTLVGIIRLDPKQLLEDGIRKELVKQLATALHNGLNGFAAGSSKSSAPINYLLVQKLQSLGEVMDGFRRSFEYIQDYINIGGLKIWQEELARIINFNLEQESNTFLREKVFAWESKYYSKAIPIPQFPRSDKDSLNFMGRLAREILRITSPKQTIYVDQMKSWYDYKTKDDLANAKLFQMVLKGLGTFGLKGLDKLYCFMLVQALQNFIHTFNKSVVSAKLWSEIFSILAETPEPTKCQSAIGKASRLWPEYVSQVMYIGQIQLLRRQIAHELNTSAKFESKFLASALANFNRALILDVEAHYKDPSSNPYPSGGSSGDNDLLYDLTNYLESVGISDPLTKIYITAKPLPNIPLFLFLLILSQLPKLQYIKSVGCLVSKKSESGVTVDGAALVVGVVTILKQFHSQNTEDCLALLGSHLCKITEALASASVSAFPPEAFNLLVFLEQYLSFTKQPRQIVEAHVPGYILDEYQMSFGS